MINDFFPMLLDFRFVLKGPCYNPMDVLNCLFSRRGYKVNDFASIFCLFYHTPHRKRRQKHRFYNKWNGSIVFLKTRIDSSLRCKERHSRGLCPTSITKTTSGPLEIIMKIWWHNDIWTWWQNSMMTGWHDVMMCRLSGSTNDNANSTTIRPT